MKLLLGRLTVQVAMKFCPRVKALVPLVYRELTHFDLATAPKLGSQGPARRSMRENLRRTMRKQSAASDLTLPRHALTLPMPQSMTPTLFLVALSTAARALVPQVVEFMTKTRPGMQACTKLTLVILLQVLSYMHPTIPVNPRDLWQLVGIKLQAKPSLTLLYPHPILTPQGVMQPARSYRLNLPCVGVLAPKTSFLLTLLPP